MKSTNLLRLRSGACMIALASWAILPATGVQAQSSNTLSVDQMVDQLSGKGGDGIDAGRTRALRPGAAVQGTAVPVIDGRPPVPHPKATGGALNLQIQFDFGSDRISMASSEVVSKLAQALSSGSLQGFQFTVIGHTDGVGSESYNLALSKRRAAAIKHYLVQHGVPAARVTTDGKGMSELLLPDNPHAADNRRVEIKATAA